MSSTAAIVLDRVLRVMQPLARLLIRSGVPYTAFATALKRVFVEAARAELASRKMSQTDSAVTLLSGVHRRDVRNLGRGFKVAEAAPRSLPGEVVARWLADPRFVEGAGAPRTLARGGETDEGSFDALVASVSRDVRPRAMLDELVRLGVVIDDEVGIRLVSSGFAPRQGFEEMSWLFADNLRAHAAASASNLQGLSNFLEQAVLVDEITEASAARLQKVSVEAAKQAFKIVLKEAQERCAEDVVQAPEAERRQRARFGVYFFNESEGDA
jgi:hypothetical protein